MSEHQVAFLLLDLSLIIALASAAGFLARKLGQPPVIGEIIAGIALGPTLFDGALTRTLFPADIRPFLHTPANLGLALFMFLVGTGIEHIGSRSTRRATAAVAIGSTALPFGLGAALAVYLAGHHHSTSRTGFILFIGVTLSITAFPVLARIIAERHLTNTAVGAIALSSAAACDAVAWAMLAFVQALSTHNFAAHWQPLLLIPFIAVMFIGVRPLLTRLLASTNPAAATVTVVFVGTLATAAATQLMGLHLVFGAFLFGMIMPRTLTGRARETITRPIEFAARQLLPVYFVIAGFNVDLSRLGLAGIGDFCMIVTLAVLGKCAGTYAGARAGGLPSERAAVIASLMNTRGLTELVALGIGLQAGLLDQQLYGAMVLMAVATTAMAGPMLSLIACRARQKGLDPYREVQLARTGD
ncbi:cation:proton antiporter [Amycolatopsis sp. DR6-1]|uniref:Cation:proton antiporter n=1 Tax=Amycolatopsis dendrobii TaxID=2760662 RepID=A0A7W3Z821_9PSEU|nr:cation:proton antiporter [Amycolatopsis dendrobii]